MVDYNPGSETGFEGVSPDLDTVDKSLDLSELCGVNCPALGNPKPKEEAICRATSEVIFGAHGAQAAVDVCMRRSGLELTKDTVTVGAE